ncbi:MAG TPA: S53 family peptidase [Marmoricola sp.]
MFFTPARRAAAVIAAAATAVTLSTAITPAQASPQRHRLPDSKPHWLSKAKAGGDVANGAQIQFGVLLKMRNQTAADDLARRVSDPASADYGKYLTSAQFRAQFAPTQQQVSAVRSWLHAQGFDVTGTLRSGMYVTAKGTTAQVEKTFDTTMRTYHFRGHDLRANSSALSLPSGTSATVVDRIQGVVGLDQGSGLKKPADTLPGPPSGARYGVQPCSSSFGQKLATDKPEVGGKAQPYAVCGYTPKQLQSAYGIDKMIRKGYDGKGITVAVTDTFAAPTIVQDMRKYNAKYGLPQFKRHQFTQQTPGPDDYSNVDLCGGNGWYGEETLDIQAVHAMAPGAKIVYVGGSDCITGLDEAWAETIDNHTADVITNSWTDGVDDLADLGQSYVDFYTQFSTEAALTGITVNFSSGDSGDHTSGNTDPSAKTAEFPADVPYVTGVGGTSLAIGRHGQWQGEWGWQNAYAPLNGDTWGDTAYSSGGGGGASQLYAQPYYQEGVVPDSMSVLNGQRMRTVPDISMPADPNTGMVVGETQEFPDGTYWDTYRIGGTSLASPLLAGVDAVAGQKAGHPLGFANPLYYSMLGSNALHDLRAPSSPVYQVRTDYVNGLDASDGYKFQLQTIDDQSSTLHDVRGYDDETGVGSPNGTAFFNAVGGHGGGHGGGGHGGGGHHRR